MAPEERRATKMKAKVRPLGTPALEKASLVGAAYVYVSRDSLSLLTGGSLENGRLCHLERIASAVSTATPTASVSAAPLHSPDGSRPARLRRQAKLCTHIGKDVNPNVVQLSAAFQAATGLSTVDVVEITLGGAVPEASLVEVKEVETEKNDTETLEEHHFSHWEFALADHLGT